MSDQPTAVASPPAAPTAPAPSPASRAARFGNYVWGVGRRKTAVARVRVRAGSGKFLINKRDVNDFFRLQKDQDAVRTPLRVTETTKSLDVFVNVKGGGISGQAGAVVLGIARALSKHNAVFEPKLREYNLLTRDPRKVERKKYGRSGARKRFQFSKR